MSASQHQFKQSLHPLHSDFYPGPCDLHCYQLVRNFWPKQNSDQLAKMVSTQFPLQSSSRRTPKKMTAAISDFLCYCRHFNYFQRILVQNRVTETCLASWKHWFLGGVPVGSPTSAGDFVCVCVWCVMCVTKIANYRGWVFYSPNLYWGHASARREYKQLSMCTLSVQYCSAWPKPGNPPTLQGYNFFGGTD